jgi:DNA-directed RNA polymerase subunit A'
MEQSIKGEGKDVVTQNGELSGVIDKASIGAEEPDSVLHRIAKDYGNDVAQKFLNSILYHVKNIHYSSWFYVRVF